MCCTSRVRGEGDRRRPRSAAHIAAVGCGQRRRDRSVWHSMSRAARFLDNGPQWTPTEQCCRQAGQNAFINYSRCCIDPTSFTLLSPYVSISLTANTCASPPPSMHTPLPQRVHPDLRFLVFPTTASERRLCGTIRRRCTLSNVLSPRRSNEVE